MISKLEKEGEAEATEKAYCDEQMSTGQWIVTQTRLGNQELVMRNPPVIDECGRIVSGMSEVTDRFCNPDHEGDRIPRGSAGSCEIRPWTVHGHGLSMAMDCPWPWTVHGHALSMAMACPWLWTVNGSGQSVHGHGQSIWETYN